MAAIYFTASYGPLSLLIATIDTERGRDVVIQSPAAGDVHTTSDRGKRARVARCEILFLQQPGLADYLERRDEFLRLAESGEAQIFTHPLDGAYLARAAEIGDSADAGRAAVSITCTFIPEADAKRVFPIAAGGSVTAGVEGVTVAAAAADDALTAAGASSSAPAAAVEAVTAWSEAEDLDSNAVFLGAAALAERIDDEIERLALADDLAKWSAYQQLVLLRYQVVLAAELFTSEVETLFDVFVQAPRPLIAICAEVYGGARAQERAAQIAKLNRVRTPARVPAGTTLKFPRAA